MDREGVSRFPGAEGRIPNFAGARLAAEKLAGHRLWKRARTIKANPDSPQTHARRTALEEGKTLIMAVPRLRDPHPFRVLEPKRLSKAAMKEAATIKGALKHGARRRPRRPARDRLRPHRLGRGQPERRPDRQGRRLQRPRVRDPDRRRQDRRPHDDRHHRPPDPDPPPPPAGDLPRPAGRPDRDAARGDRGRAPVRAPARHPLGPPAAAADPRDPDPGTDGLCLRRETVLSGSVDFPASDYGNPDPEWLKIDWREHLHRVELPGAEVNYAEIGEGEPILFVHGLGGCWRNWLENLPHFGRTHRAIALDLPGFGDSPMPSWPIDMPAYGRLIHDFCEKLGIDRGGGAGRQLDGRLRLDRGGDRTALALREAGPGLGRGDQLRRGAGPALEARVSAVRSGVPFMAGGRADVLAQSATGRAVRLRQRPPLPEPGAARAAPGADRAGPPQPRLRRRDPRRSAATTPATGCPRSRSRPWSSGG